jgi:crotonobetainyl-CoA:carnitine CoA-transferase CaiB-like acyl-CoA transferase
VGSPIRMSDAPVGVRRMPPRLGEHTEEILAEAQQTMPAQSLR